MLVSHRARAFASGLFTVLLLAGCFRTDAVLTVRPDGSARLVETVAVEGIVGLSVPVSLQELGTPRLAGATLVGVETAERTGAFVTTTTWEVPDVGALRYDLRDAGRVATMLRGAASWSRGQREVPPHAPVELGFAFEPAAADAPATLRIAVPEHTLRAADFTRLAWHRDALSERFGDPGGLSPEERAERDAYIAEYLDGLTAEERAQFDAFVRDAPIRQAAAAHVLSGTAAVRFSVAVEGEMETGGDRRVVADVALAEAFPTFEDVVALADSAAAARFDAAARTEGFDRPGLRLPPPGEVIVRFQP